MMGARVLVLAVLATLGLPARAARADGVCVTIDPGRDTLSTQERGAVREAVFVALERERVAVDRLGTRCTGMVILWSIVLGKEVTTTMTAGDRRVSGKASSLDELDLLISQLTRALVTGQPMATGTGVVDRTNVLRDQTAPRRALGFSGRRWDVVAAIGGGMLQLPAIEGKPRHRQYNIVAFEGRAWGLTGDRAAFELLARILVHDYGVFRQAGDAYDRVDVHEEPGEKLGRTFALMATPLAACNWEFGLGFVGFLGGAAPRPFARAGITIGVLDRFTDDDHYIDLGMGGYVGVGLQLTKGFLISGALNGANPLIHDATQSGYWYFATATVMLEFKHEGKPPHLKMLEPEIPTRTIHQINE